MTFNFDYFDAFKQYLRKKVEEARRAWDVLTYQTEEALDFGLFSAYQKADDRNKFNFFISLATLARNTDKIVSRSCSDNEPYVGRT